MPGQLVDARIDMVMCHDVTTPPAITMLVEKGIDRVFDPNKIVVTPDHFQPAKDIKSASSTRGWTNGPSATRSSTTISWAGRASATRSCPSRATSGPAR